MPGKCKDSHDLSQIEIAAQTGLSTRQVQIAEKHGLQKLREGLADVEDELFDEPLRAFVAGRWNGKKIVRVG